MYIEVEKQDVVQVREKLILGTLRSRSRVTSALSPGLRFEGCISTARPWFRGN